MYAHYIIIRLGSRKSFENYHRREKSRTTFRWNTFIGNFVFIAYCFEFINDPLKIIYTTCIFFSIAIIISPFLAIFKLPLGICYFPQCFYIAVLIFFSVLTLSVCSYGLIIFSHPYKTVFCFWQCLFGYSEIKASL